MSKNNFILKMKHLHRRLNGITIEENLESYNKVLEKINVYSRQFHSKSDNELKQMSADLKEQVKQKNRSDDLLCRSFALVREAAHRVLHMRPFDVQIIGGIVLHEAKLAEIQTGEGKTLTAVFPVYLNALSGNGVHVLTFNDYLARRDANWMGPVYEFLGLSVEFVQEGMSIAQRQKAYNADITYLTAKEAGFDFLRDSLCYEKENQVQRAVNYAVVDEVDSILIDEARIPLVIAGAVEDYVTDTFKMASFVKTMKKNEDFEFDEYGRNVYFTEKGFKQAEAKLNIDDLFKTDHFDTFSRLNCALQAEYQLKRDDDYIIRDGKIELVDEFTGRIADKRRWPDGLQAALEAKEKINLQSKGRILNSITLQHFIGMYPKLSGMTATARPSANEFKQFYNLDIVVIPPNKKCIRLDRKDLVYESKENKNNAIVDKILEIHQQRRPILVGTRSVDESEHLASLIKKSGIDCEVLNAKNDEQEANIIAQAGKLGAVTISTNMAGRGTDIRLGGADETEKEQVKALGGLFVLGTNKHESPRIDQQLRGRAGRQGDPGESQFIISLEDELFVRYRIKELFPPALMNKENSGEIDHPVIRFEIDRIQRIIEGQNLEIKKTINTYSELNEKQRHIFFERREVAWEKEAIQNYFRSHLPEKFNSLKNVLEKDKLNDICRYIFIFYTDKFWSQFLAEISDVREGIHLNRIGGKSPFLEFQKICIEIFDNLWQDMEQMILDKFAALKIMNGDIDLEESGIKAPTSTWTYLINDNPFENLLGMQLMGNIGLSAAAAFMFGPTLVMYNIFKKIDKKRKNKIK